jgi:hypothetical protein
MHRSSTALVFLSVVFLLAGSCDAAVASPAPLPPSARLIRAGDLPASKPEPATIAYKSARAWVDSDTLLTRSQSSAAIARLGREGFKIVLVEYLDRGSGRQNGVSWVMQLGSPAAARAELVATASDDQALNVSRGGSVLVYPVPGIAAARGYRAAGNGQVGENVLFADGPFLYLVGEGWSTGDRHPPTRAELLTGVRKLYRRVHGHPAG